jgi:peptidyl-tRNA hydrolase
MKMYILIKDDVPVKMAPVIAAHASLACYKKYEDDPDMIEWVHSIFKKVVCKVNEKEFQNSLKDEKYVLLTESSLDNREVAVAFVPRVAFTKQFRFFKMWAPD